MKTVAPHCEWGQPPGVRARGPGKLRGSWVWVVMGCDGSVRWKLRSSWRQKLRGSWWGSYAVAATWDGAGVAAVSWLPRQAAWQLDGSYGVVAGLVVDGGAGDPQGPATQVAVKQLGANGLG